MRLNADGKGLLARLVAAGMEEQEARLRLGLRPRRKKEAGERRDYPGLLVRQLEAAGLPLPVRELRFAPPRRWRFDLAWPERRLALEVDGAVWTQGRHTRGAGYAKDCEKTNRAVMLGWRVLRCPTGWIADSRGEWRTEALRLLEEALR